MGFDAWNVHNHALRWYQGGFDLDYYPNAANPCLLPPRQNGIWWDNLGPGFLGYTYGYGAFNVINAVTLVFDNDQGWYVGTGDAPNWQIDLWSVAAHEVGHASGFTGHWDQAAGICQPGPQHHTMCPSTYIGTEWDRTTEIHEETAFFARY